MSTARRSSPTADGPRPAAAILFVVAAVVVLAISPSLFPHYESSAEAEGTWEMAVDYAPVLVFSSGERTFPAPVEYYIERCSLVDLSGTVIAEHPINADLEAAGPLLYLDNQAGDVAAAYEEDRPGIPATVYARVAEVDGRVALQYWLFYVYNDGRLNEHEGDWEMVQVTLSADGSTPQDMILSRHHSGDLVPWSTLTEVINGTHPVVWVSLGSHANYEPGAMAVVHGDSADGLGERWGPEDYSLVPIGTGEGGDEPAWLRFEGAWGEPAGALGGMLGREGPPGPMYREGGKMWNGTEWHA